MTPQELINNIYPAESTLRGILISHSAAVAREALEIARRKNLPLDPTDIENAAMLHDIGIIETDAPGIHCHGKLNYMCHGIAGADMIRSAGLPEKYARVAERHTGAGLTHAEIEQAGLPLPADRSYMPETLLEKLICYADCFYSKTGSNERKSLERVRASMAKFGPGVLERFEELHSLFS